MTQTHQLAAIMFIDIVGYTALMGSNENKAMAVLDQFKQISKPLVEEHSGRWLKELGDGVLCSFGSAGHAVKCAILIQQSYNKSITKLRIGIHSGDVAFKGDDVFGDGVNVASRIQSEAAPGGICISDTVYKTVRNKEGISTVLLGNKRLKNVSGKIKLYQISNPGVEIRKVKVQPTFSAWKVLLLSLALIATTAFYVRSLYQIDQSINHTIERYDINLPDKYPLSLVGSAHFGIGQTSLSISPDGSMLVYVGISESTTKLILRAVDSYETSEMEGTEGAYFPFFSPDGKWIGFFSNGNLKKISVNGGKPIQLCLATNPSGAVWTSDDKIIFASNEGANLLSIPSSGGNITPLDFDQEYYVFGSNTFPSLIENEYLLVASEIPRGIKAISLNDGKIIKLTDYGYNPFYLPSGHLCFMDYGRLLAAPFDIEKMEIVGEIIPVLEDLRTEPDSGQLTISDEGDLIYVSGTSSLLNEIISLSVDGFEEQLILPADYYGQTRLSPDGTSLLFQKRDTGDLYMYNLSSSTITRLTKDGNTKYGAWGPKPQQVTYNNANTIMMINLTNTDEPVQILKEDLNISPYGWSPEGNILMYSSSDSINDIDIRFHVISDSENETQNFVLKPDKGNQMLAQFSPEAKFIAYTSDVSGQSEVYIQPYPPNGQRWKVSSNGGEEPIWSPIKETLYYRNNQDWFEIMFDTIDGFSVLERNKLFTRPYLNVPGYSYDITKDGKNLILLKPIDKEQTTSKLKIVKNWIEEVKRIAPKKQ